MGRRGYKHFAPPGLLTQPHTYHATLPSNFEARAVDFEAVEVAEGAEGEHVGLEGLGVDTSHVFGRDGLDARDDLLGADAAAVDYLLPRERAGAGARGFEPEQDGRDGLILDEPQLVLAHRLAQSPPH